MPGNDGFENRLGVDAGLPVQATESGDDAAVQAMLEGNDGAGTKLHQLLGSLDQ